jgi:hypothetical protein
MSPTELLAAAGVAMFGGQWKAGLARSLSVTDRTINRWLSERIEPRPGVIADLIVRMKVRRGELDGLIEAAEAYLAETER